MDRCRVWESHSDSSVQRANKPIPEPAYPAYVVNKPAYDADPARTETENKPESSEDASNELLRKLVAILTPVAPAPARAPEPSVMDKLVQLLIRKLTAGKPGLPGADRTGEVANVFRRETVAKSAVQTPTGTT